MPFNHYRLACADHLEAAGISYATSLHDPLWRLWTRGVPAHEVPAHFTPANARRASTDSVLYQEVTLEWAHGRCAWFALAAANHWQLPLVGFIDDDKRPVHVACATADGIFDAYGLGTVQDVQASFQLLGARGPLRPTRVTRAEVRKHFELEDPEHDSAIEDALHVCYRVVNELRLLKPTPPANLGALYA